MIVFKKNSCAFYQKRLTNATYNDSSIQFYSSFSTCMISKS